MNLPTVKKMTKMGFSQDEATRIREILEKYRRRFPWGDRIPWTTLTAVSDVMKAEPPEQIIPTGSKPPILFVPTGDLYDTTIFWRGGNFCVGCVAYYLEQGGYQ
jgi:hypothetical protein